MANQTAKKVINGIIKNSSKVILNLIINMAANKWLIGKELYTLHKSVPWELTKYKTFIGYCEKEFKRTSLASLYSYRRGYTLAIKFNYTDKDMARMADRVGFYTCLHLLSSMVNKMSIKSFISKALASTAALNSPKSLRGAVAKGKPVHYAFFIDQPRAMKFDAVLAKHGLIISPKGTRTHFTDAICAFIDSL